MMSDLNQQCVHEAAGGGADRPQQRQRTGLLDGDDEEEQSRHQRHDESVEQEDDLERLAHLGDTRRPIGGLLARQRVEVVAAGVDGGGKFGRRGALGRHDRERVRQRGATARVAGCNGGEVRVVRDEQRGRDAELGIGRQPDHGQLEPAWLDDDRVADVESVTGVGLAGDCLARLLGEPTRRQEAAAIRGPRVRSR